MCGITGIYSLNGRTVPERIDTMCTVLTHRGPDDDGTYRRQRVALAMRRLSIIGVDDGQQPLFDESGNVALVFNGEIYNHLALRQQLEAAGHHFASHSDAEVIVHLYEDHGPDFVHHLRGMFGLALYDRRRKQLLVARDRSGQKPLYYATAGDYLVFGSEIKALQASGLLGHGVDRESLASYLAYGFVAGERTLFRGIRKLPAGCLLIADPDGVRTHRYWDLPLRDVESPGYEQAVETLCELLDEAVRKRLMSEVPLGAFLSGGIDSSAVVALMTRHLDAPVQTFCVGFENSRFDELPHARAVAEHFGTRHHELVLRGCNLALLRDLNWHQDEPSADSAAVPTYCLARFARRHITVALTGEGGDETFAGYPHHRNALQIAKLEGRLPGLRLLARGASRLERTLGDTGPARLWKGLWLAGLPAAERHRGWGAAFTDAELLRLLVPDLRTAALDGPLSAPFRRFQNRVRDRDLLDQLLYVDSKASLADQLLMKVDKTTMAASLEARCPLLDQDLLEYATALPASFKIGPDGGKRILRRALRGLIPDAILDRPKQGFDVPLATWLLRDLEGFVNQGLLADSAPIGQYLEPRRLRQVWTKFRKQRDMRSCRQIWRLLNLAVWHEIHWPSGLLGDLAEAGPPATRVDDPTADLFVEL